MSSDGNSDGNTRIPVLWFTSNGGGPDDMFLEPTTIREIREANGDLVAPANLGLRVRAGELVILGACMVDGGFFLGRAQVEQLHRALGDWLLQHRPPNDRRRDVSVTGEGHTNVHLRGFYGDGGENEGVLAIATRLEESPMYPVSGRIIVGSPTKSPVLKGYIPDLGGFSCSPDAADLLGDELKASAAAARAAMAKGK